MSEQPSRLHGWSELLKSISKILWVIVVIILLAGLGKTFIFKSAKKHVKPGEPVKKTVVEKVDWSKVNKEVRQIMEDARLQAETYASRELDNWIEGNMKRVDENFLEWYFGYWTQQKLGLQALLSEVWHWVDSDSPSAAEKITLVVQEEFSNRVIRPVISQSQIETIVDNTVNEYTEIIREKISKIPKKYEIKEADWDRYLGSISILITGIEANRAVPLSLKAVIAGVAAGGIIAFQALKPIIIKIGSKVSARLAAKSAGALAAKTGSQVAAKTGGKFLGTIIAIGIIIWDVWDHYSTKRKAMPVLRRNIHDYLKEVKESILHDPEYGIITVIYQLEKGISKNFRNT
jgi:hypothetical protein